MDIERLQIETCERYNADCELPDMQMKVGVSDNFCTGELPLNGLRHPPSQSTCGWYLWAGEELSDAQDFFKPIHLYHLIERCPEIIRYLGLAPGWRFLVHGDIEDVWFDEKLLEVT